MENLQPKEKAELKQLLEPPAHVIQGLVEYLLYRLREQNLNNPRYQI